MTDPTRPLKRAPRRPDPAGVEDAIRLALFCAFAAGFVGVALGQVRRLRRIQRRYGDPATVARLLSEEREPDPADEGSGSR